MEIIEELNKKNKKELIDLIHTLIEDGSLDISCIENSITLSDYTPQEKIIVEKIQNKEEITNTELEYIKERLDKRKNAKVVSVLSGGKQFDCFLVNAKLEQYFELCWKIYPKKVGKTEGAKAFRKLMNEQKVGILQQYFEFILKRIGMYIEKCQENNTEEQFIMMFSTFCNSKRYL